MVSHNAGMSTTLTGPDPLINGQTYDAAAVYTDFSSGKVTTRMLMGARVNAGREDFGLLSYRDWQGNWNELRVRSGATLDAGQYVKRNPDGWYKAQGNRPVDDNKANKTNGLWLQGASDLSADFYHYERIGQHHFLGLHVANGGAQGWYEFRNDGHAYTNGA